MDPPVPPIKPAKPPPKPVKPSSLRSIPDAAVASSSAPITTESSDGVVSVSNPFCKLVPPPPSYKAPTPISRLDSESNHHGDSTVDHDNNGQHQSSSYTLTDSMRLMGLTEPPAAQPSTRVKSVFSGVSINKSLRKVMSPIRASLKPTALDGGEIIDDNVIKEGVLSKMNREGKFERYLIRLTKDEFIYKKEAILNDIPAPTTSDSPSISTTTTTTTSEAAAEAVAPIAGGGGGDDRGIPLSTVLVIEIGPREFEGSEKRERMFKLCSKQKSFFLRAKTEELKGEWFMEILMAARAAQQSCGKIVQLEDTAPIWTTGDSNCYICNKAFSFFVRRHHCRNCGRCVCEPCSPDRTRILKLDDKKLFKVCNPCSSHIKNNRTYGVQEQAARRPSVIETAQAPPAAATVVEKTD